MAEIIETLPADDEHQVLVAAGGCDTYRRKVCEECPWRVDRTGNFPAEAFRHSANTAHDASTFEFACHMSGSDKPATCAGFLQRNAVHNLNVRIKMADGLIDPAQVGNPDGIELYESYRAMAVANGVPADDPAIAKCRSNDE